MSGILTGPGWRFDIFAGACVAIAIGLFALFYRPQ